MIITVTIQRQNKSNDTTQLRLSYSVNGKRRQINVPGAVYPTGSRKNSQPYKTAWELAERARADLQAKLGGSTLASVVRGYAQDTALSDTKRAQLSRVADLLEESPLKGITPEQLTADGAEDFAEYLADRDYKPNTIRSYWAQLIWVLGRERRAKRITAEHYEGLKEVRKPSAENDNRAYIEEPDMIRLLATAIPEAGNEQFAKLVTDAFRLSYYTGLRYSDVRGLKTENITANGIRLKMQKTSGNVFIPISDKAREVLERNPKLFSALNQQTTPANRVLAKWAALADVQAVMADGQRIPVTFHAARHSFATTLLNRGVPIEQISRLMGHKSINTTQIYAKITDNTLQSAIDKI